MLYLNTDFNAEDTMSRLDLDFYSSLIYPFVCSLLPLVVSTHSMVKLPELNATMQKMAMQMQKVPPLMIFTNRGGVVCVCVCVCVWWGEGG